MKKKIRYITVVILILLIIGIILSYVIRYNIKPSELYVINSKNLVEDGGFENFNGTARDCCKTDPNMSKVFASESTDAFEGNYSLNLTSEYQCACINKPILNFNNSEKYFLSFYYKGQNPRICVWVNEIKKCVTRNSFNQSEEWTYFKSVLVFTKDSFSSSVYFYTDSNGEKVTNLYDDLQVHFLDRISYEEMLEIESINQDFLENSPKLAEENIYIFKTKSDNNVRNAELISDIDTKTKEAYYLTKGKPEITLKFPLTEIIIIIVIVLIITRLLFQKQTREIEEELSKELKKEIEKTINLSKK